MNVNAVIVQLETQISRALAEADRIVSEARRNGRSNLTAEESKRADALLSEVTVNKGKLAEARQIAADDAQYERDAQVITPLNSLNRTSRTATIRVGSEPLTYRKEVQRDSSGAPAGPSFITDLFKAQVLGDFSASERLSRHGEEMTVEQPNLVKRAVSTGGVPGFLPPQYLAELFAVYARAGRPTANLCRNLPLPAEGMSVNIPRVTTASATGIQATENATVANNDPAATLLTANVNTIAGYVVVSRQAIERGPLTEEVITADLAADYNAKLDTQILTGSGSSGQHLGILNVGSINAVTYTAATPVLVGATTPMWPKLASAIGQVMSGRFAGPTAIVMSPTEWAWMLSTCDPSTYRPIIQPNQQGGAYNPAGTLDGPPAYGGVAGWLFNLPVYLDGSMPSNLGVGTNQTAIVIADFDDLILFEDSNQAPSQLRFEQPAGNALGVMLVAAGYSAFAAGRQPKSVSVITGTGMITPAL